MALKSKPAMRTFAGLVEKRKIGKVEAAMLKAGMRGKLDPNGRITAEEFDTERKRILRSGR